VRAVVFDGVGRVRVDEVPDPRPVHPDDAVVRVHLAGICGSDLHFLSGKAPLAPGEGIGHEAVGTVEAVGPAVETVEVGDRVVVSFAVACGRCWFCRRAETGLCDQAAVFGAGAFGGGLPGAQAERLLVPHADHNLLRVPADVDDERALFVGDAASTAWYAATLAEPAGRTVAVVGAGPVGVLLVQALAALGAERVVALDREPSRLAAAAVAGAEIVAVGERNPHMALARLTEDRGADVAIDAVGHPEAFETARSVVRRGGVVIVVGMYAGESVELQLGPSWAQAVTLRFTGPCPVHACWDAAMAEVRAGRIDPLPLVSDRLPLEDAQLGYERFAARTATKVLLVP
jgi:2-desacetyl-2-hydroxyethyl bacteriochlorophyllide A dehydrogenase